jgi:hypothetical protein
MQRKKERKRKKEKERKKESIIAMLPIFDI